MNPTLKDVARRAGVSTATVSRVVNGDSRITGATRKRVSAAVEQLGYKGNAVARSLKNRQTRTIGVVTPEIANVFFMRLAQGIEDCLVEAGYSMVVLNARESTAGEEKTMDLLIEKRVDGAIIIPSTRSGAHFSRLRAAGIPVVLADRLVDDIETDAVLVDNYEATFKTVHDLAKAGHRQFGFIGGNPGLSTARERHQGFRDALAAFGIRAHEAWICHGDFHEDSGRRLFRHLMEQAPRPSTVMIANHFMQIGALKYAVGHRERLPQELLLVSFDNPELLDVAGIPSVSIEQPISEIGRRAATILLQRIAPRQRIDSVDTDAEDHYAIERLSTRIVYHGVSP